jgi:hypothetical protein
VNASGFSWKEVGRGTVPRSLEVILDWCTWQFFFENYKGIFFTWNFGVFGFKGVKERTADWSSLIVIGLRVIDSLM